MSFKTYGLAPSLLNALTNLGYSNAYPIQHEVIPAILQGRDVLGIAQTGSGKTAGYVLPILTNLQRRMVSKNRHVEVLVLVPTRELAVQVRDVFQLFSVGLPDRVRSLAVFGGVAINPQMIALQGVNVLVATPGRLIELVESNAVSLGSLQTLVLDEADKMMNVGFKDEMDRILQWLPARRQNLLFSATISDDLSALNRVLLHDPVVAKTEPEPETIELITQTGYFVPEEKKGPLLRYLLKTNDYAQVLIFTSSVYKADNVADKLRKNGIYAEAIHGKKSQGARTESMIKFKAGNLRVLVATDLISRGIDVKDLPCVINYELPRSPKDYIHRIGRTGRAETPGEAISFVTPEDEHHFWIIQKKMGKRVEVINFDELNLK